METTQIYSAVTDQATAHIRVVGRATFTASPSLRQFGEGVLTRPGSRLVFYLDECPLMDSTFLGVLTRFGITGFQAQRPVQLFNPQAAVLRLLAELGVQRFFVVGQGAVPALPWQPLYPAADGAAGDLREHGRVSLDAHRQLVSANPENANKFRTVIRVIEGDLQRLDREAGAASPPARQKGSST